MLTGALLWLAIDPLKQVSLKTNENDTVAV
jgi:hypothetical protein